MGFNVARAGTYTLNSSIGSSDISFSLSSFTDPVTGVPITMSTLNTSIAFGTIGPKTSNSELISFTGITQNSDGTATLTGVTRGLQFQYPFTASASYQLPHSGQTQFILSDAPQVFNEYATLSSNETFTGLITFAQPPVGINPGGQPNASTNVSGVVQEATVTQVNNGTTTGSSGAVLFASPADLAASNYGLNLPTVNQKAALVGDSGSTTGSPNSSNTYITQQGFQNEAEVFGTTTGCSTTNSYALTLSPAPSAYVDGQRFVFKASFATTGSPNTATLNVNSLGASNIIKNGSPGQTLIANDIINGQIVEVVRGSPNFQLQTPSANLTFLGLFASGTTSKNAADASTTQNIAHGLGVIPKWIEIEFNIYDGASGSIGPVLFAEAYYNGTTQSSTSFYSIAGTGVEATLDTTFTLNASASAQTTVGTITFDSTNIKIAWVKTGTPTGTYTGIWKAFA